MAAIQANMVRSFDSKSCSDSCVLCFHSDASFVFVSFEIISQHFTHFDVSTFENIPLEHGTPCVLSDRKDCHDFHKLLRYGCVQYQQRWHSSQMLFGLQKLSITRALYAGKVVKSWFLFQHITSAYNGSALAVNCHHAIVLREAHHANRKFPFMNF